MGPSEDRDSFSGHTYDVGVMVLFLFEMVFMDTALTIVTGACAERWKFLAFCVSSSFTGCSRIRYHWAWGGGWLYLGSQQPTGQGYRRLRWLRRGACRGITALAVSLIVGPRIGKFNRDGSSNPIIGHDVSACLIGCFILAFGWFGFNPGSTLGASEQLANVMIAVNTRRLVVQPTFGAMLYMWMKNGKVDYSMSGNGLLTKPLGAVMATSPARRPLPLIE